WDVGRAPSPPDQPVPGGAPAPGGPAGPRGSRHRRRVVGVHRRGDRKWALRGARGKNDPERRPRGRRPATRRLKGGTMGDAETLGFENDIKPLFREKDRQRMSFAFDLWTYEDVKENAEAILERWEES